MKKLLSLLSVLTISGTAVPTTIAASLYQKENKLNSNVNFSQTNNLENLNRNKRGVGDKNEFDITDKIYVSFTPNLWEEIIQEWYFSNNNLKNFQKKLKEKFNDYRNNKNDVSEELISEKTNDYIDLFSEELWNNWNIIISDWRKSDKLHRIRIVMELSGKFISVNIRNDDAIYHGNKYLNKQILNEVILNTKLGEINIINSKNILDAIKQKNSSIDISHLLVNNITNKSANIVVNSIGKYLFDTQVHVSYFKKPQLLLGKINDNSHAVILNELNYLNPDLDISQLEIINKTNNKALIKLNNNFDEITVNYEIKNKDEISVINLNELIKKAIFFKFRDENYNLKFKEIKYIDTNNLSFSNVEVTEKENSFSSSIDIKSMCNNKEFINKNSNIKSFNIPSCVYNSKYKVTFQLLAGLTKINQENKLNSWNINSEDEMKLTYFINTNYNKNNKIINELSSNFDLSNTNKQEQETIIYYLNEHSDKFEINPNEKLQVNYSPLRIIEYKNMLNLKQEITGTINTKIINSSNEEKINTLSIKEAMQILKNYNLLPNEIIINNNSNNSVIFNGKAYISSEIEGKIKQTILTSIA